MQIRQSIRSAALGLALLCSVSAGLSAQDADAPAFDGQWQLNFESQGRMNEFQLLLTLEDGELTGVAESDDGLEFPVEGRQVGDKLDFVVSINVPGHEVDLFFTGTIEDGEATGDAMAMGSTFVWTALPAG